jgi:hypothetical protein
MDSPPLRVWLSMSEDDEMEWNEEAKCSGGGM